MSGFSFRFPADGRDIAGSKGWTDQHGFNHILWILSFQSGSSARPFAAEFLFELVQREGVDDVFGFEPAFAGDAGAEAQELGLINAVGVAIDDAFDTFVAGVMPKAPIHVQSHRV
jgi:hypothetical protein